MTSALGAPGSGSYDQHRMRTLNSSQRREECRSCNWRNGDFFCDLDDRSLRDFENLGFTNVYPPGSVLFSEGQHPHGIFLLCRGSVKLSVSAGDGRTLISRIVTPGDALGLSSALTGNPFKATAETLETSHIHFVRRDDFIRFVTSTQVLSNAVRQLSNECEKDADHIRTLGLAHSASEKLANLLLNWCTSHGKETENGIRVQMLMTHEDISQLIGTSRETVSRLLKDFRDKNIVSIRGSALTVHDREALEALVLL